MAEKPNTPLLDTIKNPADLRALPREQLRQLADEVRTEMVDAVSVTGGHLGAGLGVVELTVALHAVFDTPHDRIIWDVGHQAYPHKILTGRRDRMRTLRQKDGLSGFTRRAESEYDPFGAGHSSTSISAGLGMAVASQHLETPRNVVAVIGDGAMSAGMAYEAMNNAGAMDARLVVILNDNDMSIAPPTGALRAYLARLVSSPAYRGTREAAKSVVHKLPQFLHEPARKTEEFARAFLADPAVLILDEATASLDIPSERQIQEALQTLLADRTAIIIAHRLSTVAIADRVLVMEHGRIIEDDTPEVLIAGTGKFAQLHAAWRESLV